jgi:CPA2 family monovalent cation:H+ antiporter-2
LPEVLVDVGVAFAGIILASLVAARLKFPSIPFLIVAGILLGPGISGVVDELRLMEVFANFGIVLILFFLGLEFSVGDLLSGARRKIINGVVDFAINFSLGLAVGILLLDLSLLGGMFVAGIVYISSSGLIARLIFELQRSARLETGIVLSILVFEDLVIAAYLAVISSISGSGSEGLAAFLEPMMALGIVTVTIGTARFISRGAQRIMDRISADELFIVVLFGGLILVSGLAEMVHISSAIGALLLGLILAETDHVERIEQRLRPVHDIFAGVFFLYFGLTIQLEGIGQVFFVAVLAAVVSILGKTATGLIAGRLSGLSFPASLTAGFTLIPRGEFSIILATLAVGAGLSPLIGSFTAIYILILAIAGSLLARESFRIAAWLQSLRAPKPEEE